MKASDNMIGYKTIIFSLTLICAVNIQAQTLIATSMSPKATANHNQRKIVRVSDQAFVVFEDSNNFSNNNINIIRGVQGFVAVDTSVWANPFDLVAGRSPTLTVNPEGNFFLVYETNDFLTRIGIITSNDFNNWTSQMIISDTAYKCKQPVADIDASGNLNIFWIQHEDALHESLIYCCYNNDSIIKRKSVTTKNEIEDIAVAGNLSLITNDLIYAFQFNQDSIEFFRSADLLENVDVLLTKRGIQPCISFNSENIWDQRVRFLYIDTIEYSRLIEIEGDLDSPGYWCENSFVYMVDYVCIDDVAPPVGYSYLFMNFGNLNHAFSFGCMWGSQDILNVITSNPINPSIAYRNFNLFFADYIWMENSGNGYNIYFKRDEKIWEIDGLGDTGPGGIFSIAGYPNPFTKLLFINIHVNQVTTVPEIQIFNSNAQLIRTLGIAGTLKNDYSCTWDGTNQDGVKVNSGIYIILFTLGDKKAARKVIYVNR